MIGRSFVESTELLLQIVPRVFTSERLALKGGTAINLYLDDAPRLSVDLDLVFTEIGLARDDALGMINNEMRQLARDLADDGLDVRSSVAAELGETGLVASNGRVQVKVETNMVFRGTLHPTAVQNLSPGAQEWLGREAPARVLHPAEVYASKFMAALDRQHPRDLYDVWRLYQRGPIDPQIMSTIVIYLCGHNRPPHELLVSPERVLMGDYTRALVGMIRGEIPSLDALVAARVQLRADVLSGLQPADRAFLAGFFACEPDWSLLAFPHASDLPALQWKQRNLEIFRTKRPQDFAGQRDALDRLLQ